MVKPATTVETPPPKGGSGVPVATVERPKASGPLLQIEDGRIKVYLFDGCDLGHGVIYRGPAFRIEKRLSATELKVLTVGLRVPMGGLME